MPLTSTHALVPLAVALAMPRGSMSPRLLGWAVVAAAAPDLDGLTNPVFADTWGLSTFSIYAHRGAAHSLFVALLAALIAAFFHKKLGASRLGAAVAIGLAMASHGLLDMLTNAGRPVAYLWPLSSTRLFADWRPLVSLPVGWAHFTAQVIARQRLELFQLILPMFAAALLVRLARSALAPRLGRAGKLAQ